MLDGIFLRIPISRTRDTAPMLKWFWDEICAEINARTACASRPALRGRVRANWSNAPKFRVAYLELWVGEVRLVLWLDTKGWTATDIYEEVVFGRYTFLDLILVVLAGGQPGTRLNAIRWQSESVQIAAAELLRAITLKFPEIQLVDREIASSVGFFEPTEDFPEPDSR